MTFHVSYEWDSPRPRSEDDDGEHLRFSAEVPLPVPDVGELIYLDPIEKGLGPRRTAFRVKSRIFEVQRGTGFEIYTVYVQLDKTL